MSDDLGVDLWVAVEDFLVCDLGSGCSFSLLGARVAFSDLTDFTDFALLDLNAFCVLDLGTEKRNETWIL